MKILHITPHLGGGVGTVIINWIKADASNAHRIRHLERSINPRALREVGKHLADRDFTPDVVVLHYWDRPSMHEYLSGPYYPYPTVAWYHQNVPPDPETDFCKKVIGTCDQYHQHCIPSTGDVTPLLNIEHAPRIGRDFVIGSVLTRKLHPEWRFICLQILKEIPNARFLVFGDHKVDWFDHPRFDFFGEVTDTRSIYQAMDVFLHPLRRDHYGTCEQVIGEAMAAGVPPVVLNNYAEQQIITHGLNGMIALCEPCCTRVVKHLYDQHPYYLTRDMVRANISPIYNTQAMLEKWNKVFAEVVG